MNYLKSISDLAQEVTWSPEGSNGSPITSAIQNSNEQRNTPHRTIILQLQGKDYLTLVDFPSF